MLNFEIARIFRNIGAILEIKGENVFRIRAYERAAQNLEGLSDSIEDYAKEGKLRDIPGIGQDLETFIKEFIKTGKIKAYEKLKKAVGQGILDLLNIPGIGPKKAKLFYEKIKIKDLSTLEKAIKDNKLARLPGIKEKTIENLVNGIRIYKMGRERMPLSEAVQLGDEFANALKKVPEAETVTVAGSLRRKKETVRDIDILVVSKSPKKIMDKFVNLPEAGVIINKGETKSSIRTKSGVQVDCRVLGRDSFGAALVYFTGSKDFNIKLRQLAIKKGLKVNEYGIFKKGRYLAGRTEEEVFKSLGLAYIEPELREDSGEIECAKKRDLPELIGLGDIKGDLHAHSNWSDGGSSIEAMAEVAKKRGYGYLAITDHSQGLKVAGGLSLADLKKKKKEIERLNKRWKGFKLLFGSEVDIDNQGDLDYPDEVLREFDIVVAAIHSGFRQAKKQITKRLIAACKNKYAHIIAHPTARLWGVREPYEVDFKELFKAAQDTNTHMEINSFTQRLDLNDVNCRYAKEMGVKIAINSDAHSTGQLDSMQLGVYVARRAWLEKKDVINTLTYPELIKKIK